MPEQYPGVEYIVAPREGQTVTGQVRVDFWAADWDGLRRYELLVDGVQRDDIQVSKSERDYFTWNTRKDSKGRHALSVRVTDSSNNVTSSPVVNVVVA